jgi:hypothetical protein
MPHASRAARRAEPIKKLLARAFGPGALGTTGLGSVRTSWWIPPLIGPQQQPVRAAAEPEHGGGFAGFQRASPAQFRTRSYRVSLVPRTTSTLLMEH